jgi:hypothetical protein
LSTDLLAEQSDLGVEAITLGGEADAMDGAVDGKTAHMGEHEVGEGRTWSSGSLGVLTPSLGQRDGEWGGRHGGRAEHGAALVEGWWGEGVEARVPVSRCNAVISWQNRRATLAENCRKGRGEIRWTGSQGAVAPLA